jgi:hypothetical protein
MDYIGGCSGNSQDFGATVQEMPGVTGGVKPDKIAM